MRKIIIAFVMMLCAACVASAANYLTFTAEEDSSSFGIVNETNSPDVQYSIDGGTSWIALSGGKMVTLAHKGDKALLKGNNPQGFSKSRSQYSSFKMTGKVAASGSVMSLIDGTGLSTEIPNGYCFCRSFRNCTSLTQAPELPATSLTIYCYDAMFLGCTNLKQVPTLPATTLANFCYDGMFAGCTSLTQTPELPVTTLASGCYYSMFSDCKSLTQAPALPATTLADSCYMYMFSGCTGLSEIHVSFDNWLDGNNSTAYWVRNVARTGTFICPKDLPLEYGEEYDVDRIPTGWTVQYVDDTVAVNDTVAVEANYLTFTAEEDSSSFGIVNKGDNNPDVQYSLDGGKTWTALAVGDTVILAHKGDKALLRGVNPQGFSKKSFSSFRMTGKVAASGSVMSLIDGLGLSTEIPGEFCFYKLFQGCTSLTQTPALPATVLAEGCYAFMFSGCTSLTQAPELPATTLANNCYYSMFSGCTSLTQAPELPATTLSTYCYDGMFSGCTSLTLAPELPATNLAFGCYSHMFSGCTSLAQTPKLPATTLVATCYLSMFSDCVSLTSADLSFEQYVGERSCCNDMFRGCTNLSEIKVSFEEWGDGNLENPSWVADVAPTGTFYCPKALPIEYGVDRIPEDWTVKYIDDTVAAETNYLTFTAEEDGSSFGIVNNEGNNPDIQYSLDGGETWTALAAGDTITLAHKGDKALVRGNNPEGFSKSRDQYSTFRMTGKVSASGSVMSLIDGTGLSTEIPNGYCFCRSFRSCTSLTRAPELPATTLTIFCYDAMFLGCTSLTQVPTLPATTLANFCYDGMFAGCTSLTQTPELPVTTLASGCYYSMFSDCTGLTQAPALPATTLADSCYMYMFSGCTGLTRAPELPATTLAGGCYSNMFSGCVGLTRLPQLPATTLAGDCYKGMFSGCTNLSEINVSFNDWNAGNSTSGWTQNVAPTGTFICPENLPLEYGANRIPLGWRVKKVIDGDTVDVLPVNRDLLTFTAEEDGSTFGIENTNNNPDVQYSLDGGDIWIALAGGKMVTLAHKGDKALLRGYNPEGFSKKGNNYSSFKMTGKIAASGSVMSLIDGVGETLVIPANYCFYNLFVGCKSLTKAPELPATTLTEWCYWYMFRNCTSLKQAPELPAMTLAEGCYAYMFHGCTSLTKAPELPAMTLAERCYLAMFASCKSLTQAPALPATTLANYCYCEMFSDCTSLTRAPELPATTLAETCYSGMFRKCTSLTQAPELPATTLASGCYSTMFSGCTSLKQAPELLATTLAEGCYTRMFDGCTSLTQAPKLPATTLAEGCYTRMFDGCTSLTQAPELPATTLPAESNVESGCYSSMFDGCTSLTQAPALPATTLADFCYSSMFRGCTSLSQIRVSFDDWNDGLHTDRWVADVAPTGTFICPKDLPLEYGESRIPEGWTVKYAEEGSGVSSSLSDNITVWTDELTIFVCGAEGKVSLYDMSGRIVATSNSADEERALGVPAKGAYVVRTNGGSSVVLVR